MRQVRRRGGRSHPWSAIYARGGQHRNGPTTEQLRAKGNGRSKPCRTLDDMTPDEIAALEAQLGARVQRTRRAR
jgi:hypothetical protein